MGDVTGVDKAQKCVFASNADRQGVPIAYDYLILATGARHSYFGHYEFEQYAPGLTTLAGAVAIRNKIMGAFEQAEAAHDSRSIGLAHYELGQCYRQVGDVAIVREHISKAASALHAAGDRRHLALVHSLSSISLAQLGRYALDPIRHPITGDLISRFNQDVAMVQLFLRRRTHVGDGAAKLDGLAGG